MTDEAGEQLTPIDRPLMRSDLNDLREAVKEMGDRQLEMLELSKGFVILHDRVQEMQRTLTIKLWVPTVANTIVLLLNIIFVLWVRPR